MDFWLTINFRGLGGLGNEIALNGYKYRRGLYGFRDQLRNNSQGVLRKDFVRRRRQYIFHLRLISCGVHDNRSITFVIFEKKDIRVIVKVLDGLEFLFR